MTAWLNGYTNMEEIDDLQSDHSALAKPVSIWRHGSTGALVLTFLSTFGISINVHNPIEAIGNLLFSVPVTFLFWWVVCSFLVWVWRKLGNLFRPI